MTVLGNSVATPSARLKGQVIEVKDMDELEQLGKEKLTGKIVFFNFKLSPTYITTFKAYGESVKGRVFGPANAAKYGATGAIVRSLSTTLNDYPHIGLTIYNDSFPEIPAVAISTNDAELLSSHLKKNKVSSVWFKTKRRMLPDTTGYNVIGEIKGSDHPEEIITAGRHLDSWDLAEGG